MSQNRDYKERLEKYIESERYSHALYKKLAGMCRGANSAALLRMSADEARHLKAMQMEYYLLTGDSLPGMAPEINGTLQDNLRQAYGGEWDASQNYAREARLCEDEVMKKLYQNLSSDELRHRRILKSLAAQMFGG